MSDNTQLQTFSVALLAMKAGKTVARKSWNGTEKVMRLMKKDEWDGAFDISEDMLMINEGHGWGVWCMCFHDDVLAEDWIVL
jgi:Protein of unknown function (DUF2829)